MSELLLKEQEVTCSELGENAGSEIKEFCVTDEELAPIDIQALLCDISDDVKRNIDEEHGND